MMVKCGKIRVATCQFAVTGNARRNAAMVRRQMKKAKSMGAEMVHFSESALTGYGGKEILSWDGYDWDVLRTETESVCELARKEKVWVIVGSAHPVGGSHLPHNCLYIIDPRGELIDRYDKRFCTSGDLDYYTPGNHFSVFEVNGVTCCALICYDLRFPEIYRECKRLGVQCLFQSFYNARAEKGPDIWTRIMRQTMQCRCATNYIWASINNSSAWYQSWPSSFIRPDGEIAASLRQHQAGVMVNTVNTGLDLYDASGPFRDAAMRGTLHSGTLVRDSRSDDRTSL
jgi:predicted amidohydrolase